MSRAVFPDRERAGRIEFYGDGVALTITITGNSGRSATVELERADVMLLQRYLENEALPELELGDIERRRRTAGVGDL